MFLYTGIFSLIFAFTHSALLTRFRPESASPGMYTTSHYLDIAKLHMSRCVGNLNMVRNYGRIERLCK